MTESPSPLRRALEPLLRGFTRLHRWIYLRSGGRVGRRMTGPVTSMLLHTTGRRSGQRRSVALAYTDDGDAFVVVASNFGGERPPGWLLNLEGDPRAQVNIGRRSVAVTAEVLMPGAPEYERVFQVANKANRGIFERYRATMTRPLPVVRLVPDRR
ncbi:MAG TPA: nitroreductase family deazaflavin-dependent oxidoreductase [Acidimicrobiaceae bacterium]|nr:nitroreductase family deazaflavin-dependent oxidoreductase [Acidimicrobiaceae bacterium]